GRGGNSAERRNGLLLLFLQDPPQHLGVTEVELTGRRDQRSGAALDQRAQRLELVLVLDKFGLVAAPELGKARRIVAVPFAQARRWGEVARAGVKLKLGFGHAARPESVDENAQAVARTRLVIGTLDGDRWHRAPRIRFLLLARVRFGGRHRLLREMTFISSFTLRRCSVLLPDAIAFSTQCAA